MSQENLEIVRQVLEAINRRDRDAWLRLQDPEVEFRADPEWPESETVRGREAVWEFVMDIVDAWEPAAFVIGEVIDAGSDRLLVRLTRPVQGKTSGLATVLDYWCVMRFHEKKVLGTYWFATRDQALEAVGLSE
jgi:ketosteroid isomerase-like protein